MNELDIKTFVSTPWISTEYCICHYATFFNYVWGVIMLIDLSDVDTTRRCLVRLLSISEDELDSRIRGADNSVMDAKFSSIKDLVNFDVESLIRDSYIRIYHVTTAFNDDISVFRSVGVRNLHYVLKKSSLHDFLNNHEIQIDLDNFIIKYNKRIIKMEEDKIIWDKVLGKLKNDYAINGFYTFVKSRYTYASSINRVPEILFNIEDVFLHFPEKIYTGSVHDWIQHANCYVIMADTCGASL